MLVFLTVVALSVSGFLGLSAFVFLIMGLVATLTSLFVSIYVYDLSGFYQLDWLDSVTPKRILTLNAGFDETSELLARRFPKTDLRVCDFYDPQRHTEPSIRRARNSYPPYPGTVSVRTANLPFESGSCDVVLAIMSAHEVRDDDERAELFGELRRCIKIDGHVIVVEHVRDAANLFAYNIGAFHFFSRAVWLRTFDDARLAIIEERKINPWITAFFLTSYATTD